MIKKIIGFILFALFGVLLFSGKIIPYLRPPAHPVEIHGVQCHLEYMCDHINSHGGCIGQLHDKIVCP